MRSKFSIRTLLFALMLVLIPASSFAGVFVSINIAPPPLPVYSQPYCPGPGYIWTPGYWAYGPEGYFWVPGTWVVAPFVGGLWTPGYWGWGNGLYAWHGGYWGTQVGFYGGVNYGYGYGGHGYEGGYWHGNEFNYNRSVNNVNVTNIHNVYNKTVINNVNVTRVSYNGGNGGVQARPSAQEQQAIRYKRQDALPAQMQHEQAAASNRMQLASVNHGAPTVAATPRPGAFQDRNVVRSEHVSAPPAHVTAPQNEQVQRSANPAGSGRAPLITAHPNGTENPAHEGQPANRPSYNAAQQNAGHPSYNAPQQHQQAAQPQPPHYNAATPQHQQSPQPQYQQRPAPQPQHAQNAPHSQPAPHEQSAPHPQPAPHEQSAPHSQPAPHEGGEPHGGEPHGGGHSR
jgi:WXXGXW repeat (2 copies)